MVETTQTATVGEDGVLHLEVSGLEPGRTVEVRVYERGATVYREPGRLEGKLKIADDFDAPLPEMEPYS